MKRKIESPAFFRRSDMSFKMWATSHIQLLAGLMNFNTKKQEANDFTVLH
jgi:hypothetical protein